MKQTISEITIETRSCNDCNSSHYSKSVTNFKQMKKIHILYFAMAFLLISVSCTKDPVVLEFDDSYTPKPPKKGALKEEPPVDLLTVYTYFQESQKDLVVNRVLQTDGSLEIKDEINNVEVQVKTTIPVEAATTFEVTLMENEDEAFPKIVKGLTVLLPEDVYNLENSTLDFKVGDKEVGNTIINLKKDAFKKLDKMKEYVLPLKIKITKGEAVILNYFVLHVTLQDVEALPEAPNVSPSYNFPTPSQDKVLRESALHVNSDYATGHLYKLTDSNLGSNWWVKPEEGHWLSIGIDNLQKIKAIVIKTPSWNNKNLKACDVDTPVNINHIKLTNFKGYDSFVDLMDLYLVIE